MRRPGLRRWSRPCRTRTHVRSRVISGTDSCSPETTTPASQVRVEQNHDAGVDRGHRICSCGGFGCGARGGSALLRRGGGGCGGDRDLHVGGGPVRYTFDQFDRSIVLSAPESTYMYFSSFSSFDFCKKRVLPCLRTLPRSRRSSAVQKLFRRCVPSPPAEEL